MARWGAKFSKGAASVQTVGHLNAAASSPRRAKIHDWSFGCTASANDSPFIHIVQRATTAPTGAAVTPRALDPADTLASTIVATDTVTADGTLTSAVILEAIPLNGRGAFRWCAVPGMEMIIPATASNGLMFGLSAASTVDFTCGIMFEEL